MMHPKLRWVMFTAAVGIVACKGDPTDSLRNGAHGLRASPATVFVAQGDSVAILTELFDEQGNRLAATFSMTSSDPAQLPVDLDNSFIPVYDANNQLVPPTDATRARFFVKGVGLTAATLTVTSGGLTQTVPVVSFPSVVGSHLDVGNLSSTTTVLGDTVTVTIPAPWKFSPSAVAIATAPGRVITVDVSADSTSLRFIPGPGIDTTVSFQPAVLTYSPNLPFVPRLDTFRLTSSAFLNTPPIGPVTVSNTAPALGAPVTATAPTGFVFTSLSTVAVIDTATHDTTLASVTGLSPDSTQLTFIPAPTSLSGLTEIGSQVVEVLPALGPYTILGSQTVTAPSPPANFTAVLSNAAPALQDTVTLTANAPFRFLPTATLLHGSATGTPAITLSVSADSSTISFIAAPGAAAGLLYANDIVLGFLPAAPFAGFPSDVNITPVATGFAGTGSLATAPLLALPASGQTITYVDVGTRNTVTECDNSSGAPCRVYKINVAAPGDLTFTQTWEGTTDEGVYVLDPTGTSIIDACDSGGNGGGGPESCTITFAAAGTYYVTFADFGPFYPEPEPKWIRLDITAP